jgi:galacturan 1,4-alpha-galacturonidase
VVETNAHFSIDQVRPMTAGALPPGLAPWIARHSANQEMIVEAAITRNPDLAFQAVLGDPANVLDPKATWEMFQRMLTASREFLPGWKINGSPA